MEKDNGSFPSHNRQQISSKEIYRKIISVCSCMETYDYKFSASIDFATKRATCKGDSQKIHYSRLGKAPMDLSALALIMIDVQFIE